MARIAGKTKGWLWWLAGMCCAVFFGSRAEAMDAVALYGVRPAPAPEDGPVTDGQKKKAAAAVDAWLSAGTPVEPNAADKASIAAQVRSLGDKDFSAREAASRTLVGFGTKALMQLREAAGSGDAEVTQRSTLAINEILEGARQGKLTELRGNLSAAQVAIRERQAAERQTVKTANEEAAKLEADGRKDEAASRRAAADEANRRYQELVRLSSLVVYGAVSPGPMAKYGVRPDEIQMRYGVRPR
jgi:hypothetical protein